jgi:hypothetical protein
MVQSWRIFAADPAEAQVTLREVARMPERSIRRAEPSSGSRESNAARWSAPMQMLTVTRGARVDEQ